MKRQNCLRFWPIEDPDQSHISLMIDGLADLDRWLKARGKERVSFPLFTVLGPFLVAACETKGTK